MNNIVLNNGLTNIVNQSLKLAHNLVRGLIMDQCI